MLCLASSISLFVSSPGQQLSEHELEKRTLLDRHEQRRERQRLHRQSRRHSSSGSSLPSIQQDCPSKAAQECMDNQNELSILPVASKENYQGKTLMPQIEAFCDDFPTLLESCFSSDNDDLFDDDFAQTRMRGLHAGMARIRLEPLSLEAKVEVADELAPEPSEASHSSRSGEHFGGIMLKVGQQSDEHPEELDIVALDATNVADLSHQHSCVEAELEELNLGVEDKDLPSQRQHRRYHLDYQPTTQCNVLGSDKPANWSDHRCTCEEHRTGIPVTSLYIKTYSNDQDVLNLAHSGQEGLDLSKASPACFKQEKQGERAIQEKALSNMHPSQTMNENTKTQTNEEPPAENSLQHGQGLSRMCEATPDSCNPPCPGHADAKAGRSHDVVDFILSCTSRATVSEMTTCCSQKDADEDCKRVVDFGSCTLNRLNVESCRNRKCRWTGHSVVQDQLA